MSPGRCGFFTLYTYSKRTKGRLSPRFSRSPALCFYRRRRRGAHKKKKDKNQPKRTKANIRFLLYWRGIYIYICIYTYIWFFKSVYLLWWNCNSFDCIAMATVAFNCSARARAWILLLWLGEWNSVICLMLYVCATYSASNTQLCNSV